MKLLLSSLRAALLAVAFSSAMVSAGTARPWFADCPENFYRGHVPNVAPAMPGQVRALCFDSFAVLHSGQSKTPVYVAQHLTPASLKAAKAVPRVDRFYEEARLPRVERARLEDYRGSGWDRGHLAEAVAMPNETAMAQSFSLANMTPQAPKLNRGLWKRNVEAATRKYVARGHEVYVLTGPLFLRQVRTVGPGRVWVPDALFKLVYDPQRKHAWVHLTENSDSARMDKPLSYPEFVARTGQEWLPPGAVSNVHASLK